MNRIVKRWHLVEVTKRERNETLHTEKTMVGTENLKVCTVDKRQRGRIKYLQCVLKNVTKRL